MLGSSNVEAHAAVNGIDIESILFSIVLSQ
jgi:hypothetical protein